MKSQNRPSTAAWPVILAAPGIRSSRSCKVERTGEASMPGQSVPTKAWRGLAGAKSDFFHIYSF